jgi:hypothetical protein
MTDLAGRFPFPTRARCGDAGYSPALGHISIPPSPLRAGETALTGSGIGGGENEDAAAGIALSAGRAA